MTYIRLIRHGETDWNFEKRIQGWTDIPLNETGRKQALQARPRLTDKQWDLFITSSLSRAKETARVLNETMQLPCFINDAFRERCYGEVEGMLRIERQAQYPDGIYPGAETREALLKRVLDGLQEIHEQYNGKHIILSTHGGVINAILTAFSDGKLGFDRTVISNLSSTDIEYIGDHWHIHTHNQTDER